METPKVLLIDDEVTFIGNISKMLTYRGYEVKTAGSGEDGLKTLLESSFDVVVLDLRMPGISGMDVLKTIKRNVIDSPRSSFLQGLRRSTPQLRDSTMVPTITPRSRSRSKNSPRGSPPLTRERP